MTQLFVFGLGYSARAIAGLACDAGFDVYGTSRSEEGVARIEKFGWHGLLFPSPTGHDELRDALARSSHVLLSIAPDEAGDPVLCEFAGELTALRQLRWLGYLSTVGVYGDHGGAWVNEMTIPVPVSLRSKQRVAAEMAWQDFAQTIGARLQIFRLAGIYGPGRSAIDKLRSGTARRIIKPGQVFNRIHVDDIAQAVFTGLQGRGKHVLYNVCDDEPAPPQDVIAYGARALGVPVPLDVAFEDAGLSAMGRSFYKCKRVSNGRLKADFGISLRYPTYREGIDGLADGASAVRSSGV